MAWRTPSSWSDAVGPRPVVMLTTSYPSDRNPTAGLFVRTLADHLRGEGHEVHIVASEPHASGIPEQFEAAPWAAAFRFGGALGALIADGVRATQAAGARARVVGHWMVPGGLAAHAVAQLTGTQASTIVHSSAARAVSVLPGPLARWAAAASLGRPGTDWVASCDDVARAVLAYSPAHSRGLSVMPMPVRARRVGVPPPGPPWRVATLGRLVPIKGLDVLVRALAGRDVELHVCGEGPVREALGQSCVRLGVRARFHGVVLGPAKDRLLSSMHGLAHPSRVLGVRREGAAVAVHEAVAYDLPVFVTATGGLPAAAAGGVHVVAEPGMDGLGSAWPAFEAAMQQHWHNRRFDVG
jgi:glycosyltransferase involved in cell wall biosynthesis